MLIPLSDPVVIPVTIAASWEEVDVSELIDLPGTASTGILVRIKSMTGGSPQYGIQSADSTLNQLLLLYSTSQIIMPVAMTSDHKIKVYQKSLTSGIIFEIIGYFTSGDTFFADPIDIMPDTFDAWVETDLSIYAPSAIGFWLLFVRPSYTAYPVHDHFGARDSDSTDNNMSYALCSSTIFTKCNANQLIDLYMTASAAPGRGVYLLGYSVYGSISAEVNSTVVTPASYDAYVDLPALPAGATMGIYECVPTGAVNVADVRRNGDTVDNDHFSCQQTLIAKCDENRVCEGWSGTSAAILILRGYALADQGSVAGGNAMMGSFWVG